MEERRSDYIDLKGKIQLLDNEIKHLNQHIREEKESITQWVNSLKKHNARLMHLQGYEDRFNDKIDTLKRIIENNETSRSKYREDIKSILNIHGKALFGIDGNNGLNTRMRVIEESAKNHRINIRIIWVAVVGAAIKMLFGVIK